MSVDLQGTGGRSPVLLAGTRLGPYEIAAKLGEGGMGEVYRAHDTKLHRDVAIKVLPAAFTEDRERLARFEREAQVLASLNHPNIAAIYGLEESDGVRALVMELVEGPTLAERLASGPLPLDESLSFAEQIAEALEEAHEKGIVHRDLKPQNIKASIEGKVKALDFGLAKALEPAGAAPVSESELAHSPTLTFGGTQLGVVLGTAAYMAPEQARGKAVDRRADIWAFGVVLYEMLTGRTLFAADTVSDTLAGVLKSEIDFDAVPVSTPPAIRRLLRRCLERDPKQRLQAIGEARIALSENLGEAAGEEARAVTRGAASRALHLLPWALAVALGILAAVLALRRDGPLPSLPLRSAIDLPPGLTLDSYDRSLALSPDGRLLLLAADDEKSGRHLYLRRLDKLELRELPGTDGASYPFWSPGSRAFGFFSQGKLRRFDLPDGPAQTLCDAPIGRGAAWGPGDRIVFAPGWVGGLRQVSAAGGMPQAFGTEPPEGVSYRLPQFLPENEGLVAYASGDRAGPKDGVILFDASGREARPLLAGESEAQPAAPGFLAFERGGLMMIQRFDRDRRELTGAAAPIADDLQFTPDRHTSNFSFSAVGSLVYQLAPPLPLFQFEWFDRQGAKLGSVGEPMAIEGLSVSPDGRRALVSIKEKHEISRIWLLDLVRGVRSPLTSPGQEVYSPAWSPDGLHGAFLEWRQGVGRTTVVAVDDPARSRTLLENPGESDNPTGWSPDGKMLLFNRIPKGSNQSDIALLATDGKSAPLPVTDSPAQESGATFSPDGRWITYVSDESGRPEVYVVAYPALGRRWPITSGGVIGAPGWWSANELGYLTSDLKAYTVLLQLSGESVEVGAPRADLGGKVWPGGPGDFVPVLNRSLVGTPLAAPRTRAPLVLLTNWRAELEK
jgi:hypothetical protein